MKYSPTVSFTLVWKILFPQGGHQGNVTLVRIIGRVGRNLERQLTFPLDFTNEETEVQILAQMMMMATMIQQFLTPIYFTFKGVTYINTSYTPTGTVITLILQMRKVRLVCGSAEVQRS